MPKITYTFTEQNQPSSTAIRDLNQHIYQLLKNPMYCHTKKEHAFPEAAHSTQKPLKS